MIFLLKGWSNIELMAAQSRRPEKHLNYGDAGSGPLSTVSRAGVCRPT
jgi:hypothetical protein